MLLDYFIHNNYTKYKPLTSSVSNLEGDFLSVDKTVDSK